MGAATDEQARTPASGRKRKHDPTAADSNSAVPNYPTYDDEHSSTPTNKARKPKQDGEKRLRRFRDKPPQSFQDVYERATTQRFYVLSRKRGGTIMQPEETVEMTGSTGNIYTVVIARQPVCDCPQGKEGNQCKHIVYVLARVLRAKHEYVYQLALLSTELQDIFANAPPPMDEDEDGDVGDSSKSKNRKPVEGNCPICFSDMEAEDGEAIVWCRAACGQNIHKKCFEMWATTKRQQGRTAQVTCPYCRSVWEGDKDMVNKIEKTGDRNGEGYVNIAEQLGINQERDTSSYSRWWSKHPQTFRRHRDYY